MDKSITMKKILIVCDSSRSLIDFRGNLIEKMLKNYEVHIFTPKIENEKIKLHLTQIGALYYETKLNGGTVSIFDDLKYIFQLYKYIKRLKPDVFFPYAIKPVIYGTFLARILKIKKIVPMLTGLGYNFTEVKSGRNIVVIITRTLLKWSISPHANLSVIFQNKDDVLTLSSLGIINKKHSVAVVNGSGVDLAYYENSIPDIKNITFLMIARLINAKGIKEYFDAAEIVKTKYPEVVFNLIGSYDSNIDAISKQLYHQIQLGQTINYLGAFEDVRIGIKNASVIVLPSYREGVPRSVLEGMAMGRPIITSNAIGCKETICMDPGKTNGFLVPVKDSTILATKMEHFIINKNDILIYGARGRAYASEKFDVNIINNDLFKIMQLDS